MVAAVPPGSRSFGCLPVLRQQLSGRSSYIGLQHAGHARLRGRLLQLAVATSQEANFCIVARPLRTETRLHVSKYVG